MKGLKHFLNASIFVLCTTVSEVLCNLDNTICVRVASKLITCDDRKQKLYSVNRPLISTIQLFFRGVVACYM